MCLKCGKQTPNPRFCSRSCAASFNNKGVRRHGGARTNCLECNNKNKFSQSKFCSVNCSAKYRKDTKVQQWKRDEITGSAKSGNLGAFARQYMLEEADFKCTKCGWCEINPIVAHGKPILTVDHLDGDFTNNKYNNLKVLCYNCHTLTPTFGYLNKGNGPTNRIYTGRAIYIA